METNIDFKEMVTGLFDVSWMTPNELLTICAAAEMYADGRLKHFAKYWGIDDAEASIKKYKESTNETAKPINRTSED